MSVDVSVVGSGPNGLAAAVILARAGRSVEVHAAVDEIGGGTRTASLFDDGVRHDLCSAVGSAPDSAGRGLPVFGCDGAGCRGTRDGWLVRGESSAG
jgi:phytoene dehydrogenase-like protein